jgi:hypothetical protein
VDLWTTLRVAHRIHRRYGYDGGFTFSLFVVAGYADRSAIV